MAEQVFPTKGNLIAAKKTLELSKTGFGLLDRKRSILTRELMDYVDRAKKLERELAKAYSQAYSSLQKTYITMGAVDIYAQSIKEEDSLSISFRSVMGVEMPTVKMKHEPPVPEYGLLSANSDFDNTFLLFKKAKELTAQLAEVENCVYRLAQAIKKTKKRANSLKNIIIPEYEARIKYISDYLEEKDRDEFSRMKIIKTRGEK